MEQLFKNVLNPKAPKVIAWAKNYATKGSPQAPKAPMVFTKCFSALCFAGQNIKVVKDRKVAHELELGFMIGKGGKHITAANWKKHIGGYFLALDMTDAGIQKFNMAEGFPWDLGKSQDSFFPISQFVSVDKVKDPHNLFLRLSINGKEIHNDCTKGLYYDIPQQIEYVSSFMTLNPGDLFLTGTPKIGPVELGDQLVGQLLQEGKELTNIKVKVESE